MSPTVPTSGIRTAGYPMVPGVLVGAASHHGHYAGQSVVGLALDLGWADEMARGAYETYEEWYHREDWAHADHWHDLVAEAEAWLNDHTVGGSWHWCDGDFRLDGEGDPEHAEC